MIRRLRTRHRRAMVGLAIALPVAFGAAIAARAPIPTDSPEPRRASAAEGDLGPGIEVSERFGDARLACRLWPAQGERPALVELAARESLGRPDVLIYWGPAGGPLDRLVGDELLLGSLGARERTRVELPAEAHRTASPNSSGFQGRLLLFSLGHGEVFAAIDLGQVGS